MIKAEEIIAIATDLRVEGDVLVAFVQSEHRTEAQVRSQHEHISDIATVVVDRLGADDLARLIYVLAIMA